MSWLDDALHRAIAAVVLAGALAGLIGVQVVLRRLSFRTMALTHATFPGVVAAAILGIDLALGGVAAGAVVALGVHALSRRPGQNASAATGVVLSAGFALGAGLIATQDGFSRDLSAFLVGSVLTVTTTDLLRTALALVLVAAVLAAGARPLRHIGFDPVGARAAGIAVGAWDLGLLLVLQLVVVTVVPAVGTILAVALIVAPAAAARRWTDRLPVMTALAVLFAILAGLAGLYASYRWDIAAGAAIALAAAAILLLSSLRSPASRPAGPAGPALPGAGAARSPAGGADAGVASGGDCPEAGTPRGGDRSAAGTPR